MHCPHCVASVLPFHNCSFINSEDSFTTFPDLDDSSVGRAGLPPATSGLRIAHLNCRSFLAHKDDIFDLMYTFHINVLTL